MSNHQINVNKAQRVRLICNLLTLTFGLVSLILLKMPTGGFWFFTWVIGVVIAIAFALQHVYLSMFLQQKNRAPLWKTLCFWLGFLATLYIDSLMLRYGVIGARPAGLFALTLLALALFYHGLFDDFSSLLASIGLALMIAGAIVIQAYLLLVIIPIAIGMSFFTVVLLRKNAEAKITR